MKCFITLRSLNNEEMQKERSSIVEHVPDSDIAHHNSGSTIMDIVTFLVEEEGSWLCCKFVFLIDSKYLRPTLCNCITGSVVLQHFLHEMLKS